MIVIRVLKFAQLVSFKRILQKSSYRKYSSLEDIKNIKN